MYNKMQVKPTTVVALYSITITEGSLVRMSLAACMRFRAVRVFVFLEEVKAFQWADPSPGIVQNMLKDSQCQKFILMLNRTEGLTCES
jgi:hypothetical protein